MRLLRLSTDDLHRLAARRGGDCLSKHYINNTMKLRWRCAKGHVWRSIPKCIRKGHWCPTCARKERPKKYSILDFKRIAKRRGGQCLSAEYKDCLTKLRWECAKGHQWEAVPMSVRRGSWCPYCVGFHKNIADMRKLAERRGGKCLSRTYSNAKTDLLWKCAKGHCWEAVPSSIKAGTWCPRCAPNPKRTLIDMQALAVERGGKCLSTEYVNARTGLLWKCAEGHRWKAWPSSIRSGSWCPQCSSGLAERICREYFEQLFGYPFPKARPTWLRLDQRTRLELDGYCEELRLAFEHQGPHHYGVNIYSSRPANWLSKRREHDREKRLRCREHGVVLISVPEIPVRLKPDEVKDYISRQCKRKGVALPRDFARKRVSLIRAYSEPRAKRELEQLSLLARSRGGECLSRTYKGALEKLLWQCKSKHRWRANPWDIKAGNWCPHCRGLRLTIRDMRALAEKTGGKCLSSRYSGTHKKLLWECHSGHRWKAEPASIRMGTWCPTCALRRRIQNLPRLTIQRMRDVAATRGGECLSTVYRDGKTKMRWRCSAGHEWQSTYFNIRNGAWCRTCATDRRRAKPTSATEACF
jgi:thiol-disulfide isomerase/thioredoxin